VPLFDPVTRRWRESEEPLLDGETQGLFTEHSGRSTLPSLAMGVEVSKENRDYLGRRSPGGSDVYVRSYREVVGQIQLLVHEGLLAGLGAEQMAEHDVADKLRIFLRDRRGMEDQESVVQEFDSKVRAVHSVLKENCGKRLQDEVAARPVPPLSQLGSAAPRPKASAPPPRVQSDAKYLVVYDRHRAHAKLHLIDSCAVSRRTVADSVELKEAELDAQFYSSRCRLCFRPQTVAPDKVELELEGAISAEECSTDSSSSSE
jgi:hypothetical protein